MTKEDMIREAVEQARRRAKESTDETGSNEEKAAKETSKLSEEQTDTDTSEGTDAVPEDGDAGDTPGKDAGDGENEDPQEPADGEKKEGRGLFGRKNKKDKKDEQIESLTDRLTRQMAEFDNFRKRTEKEKSAMYEIGAKSIVEQILPVVDSFERGLSAARETMEEGSEENAFLTGMDQIYKQLMKALEDAGVRPIEAVGAPFDPNFHNAVMHVDDEALGENVVAEEFQKGYMYRDSVVRHSMVKVAN